jgi:hypothetical protein
MQIYVYACSNKTTFGLDFTYYRMNPGTRRKESRPLYRSS